MKKIVLEITFEDDDVGVEIRRLVKDFCCDLQEDILPDAEYTLKMEDEDVTV